MFYHKSCVKYVKIIVKFKHKLYISPFNTCLGILHGIEKQNKHSISDIRHSPVFVGRTLKQDETNTWVWTQSLFLKQRRVFCCVTDHAKISLG